MDFRSGGAEGSGGGEKDKGSTGGGELKRKWSDFEASMKVMKAELDKECAEKSTKILRLMGENISLQQRLIGPENPSFRESFAIHRPPARAVIRPDPFVRFPEEVWEMIIENMDRSSDLQMLCLAFPQLEPLMKKKAIFLFQSVVPLVLKRLLLEDINKCRLVCGKWNEDICEHLANFFAPNLLPDSSSNDTATSKSPYPDGRSPYGLEHVYSFRSPVQTEKFLKKMTYHPGNPFLGRILRLFVDGRRIYWESLLELVKRFGEYVRNFEMEWYRSQNQTSFYEKLRELLLYLPNLKYLTINCYFKANLASKRNLAVQLMTSPLPPLPDLQSLSLALNSETEMISVFSSFLSKQIYRLELLNGTLANVNLKDEFLRGLINLKYLKVELKSKEDILRVLKFPSANLKKLCLDSSSKQYNSDPVLLTLEQVASLLKKFVWLENLELSRLCRIEACSSSEAKLPLSRLQILKIAICADEDDLRYNLDFLLWFTSLKHLKIATNYSTAATNADIHSTLKIRRCLSTYQRLDSNIWTLVPSLEILELGCYKFTREMLKNRVG